MPKKTPKTTTTVSTPTRPSSLSHRLIWLVILCVLVSPAALWIWNSKSQAGGQSRMELGKTYHCKPGLWGELEYVRMAIELPDHFINVDEIDSTEWIFPNLSREQLVEFFKTSGLSRKELDQLAKAKWEQVEDSWHISPDDEFIWNLSAKTRAKIYARLGRFEENVDQFFAFAYRPELLSERLAYSGLSDSTVTMFKTLLYQEGELLRFADSDVVLRKLEDRHERLRFVKTISRRSSLLVKLKVTPESDIDSLIEYWGQGGRSKDLRPLLESLSRVPEGCKIDVAHLLPAFARQRIYTYPNPDEPTAANQDCHWTSLNFFNNRTREPLGNSADLQRAVQSEYMQVGTSLKEAHFGDIIFLQNTQEALIHSAVYIADDIVFTKNGGGLNQPWVYMRMEDMLPYYMTPADPVKVLVFRKNAG
jgi:hypothetical protein